MASALPDSDLRPHDRFFFSDGSLYLLVENSLYCVHKYLFEIHATMFPVREQETSLSNPYVLEDVKKSNFDRLLANLYPRTLAIEETQTTIEPQTTQDWISILELASKWGFESLRSKAISKIKQTLDSPVDMVTLGRQYGIPDVLLPGYAVLCQSTVPLSYEEGLRLGMEDVVNIYRIRNELYGSGITPVPLKVALAKVEEAGLGAQRPKQELDSEQASTWTDVESVAASQISAEIEEERGSAIMTRPPLDVASTGAPALLSQRTGQQHIDAHSPSDKPPSVALGNEGGDDTDERSSVFSDHVSDFYSRWSEYVVEGFNLVDELPNYNFELLSVEIMQWVNTKDIRKLHQITRLILRKAIESNQLHAPCNPFVRICKAMVKYTQTMHQLTRLIVEKAMEEPHQLYHCSQLCNSLMYDTNGRVTTDGSLFCKYLGEICLEKLEAIVASVAAGGDHMARIRRLRLIEFIRSVPGYWLCQETPVVIEKWMTALLDADNEEKVTTLCMLMMRIGGLDNSLDMNSWLQRMKSIAEETSKPRVRELLQEVTKGGRVNWVVAEPREDCTVQ